MVSTILIFSCTRQIKNIPGSKIYITDTSGDSSDESLSGILTDYLNTYNEELKIDTTYIAYWDTMTIHFRFYCDFDSAINLPEKYIQMYGLKEFITHNFQSEIHYKVNHKIVLDTIVKKSMFEKYIDSSLVHYGIVTAPILSKEKNGIRIEYSISIPLTDVGREAELNIDTNGIMKIKVR